MTLFVQEIVEQSSLMFRSEAALLWPTYFKDHITCVACAQIERGFFYDGPVLVVGLLVGSLLGEALRAKIIGNIKKEQVLN